MLSQSSGIHVFWGKCCYTHAFLKSIQIWYQSLSWGCIATCQAQMGSFLSSIWWNCQTIFGLKWINWLAPLNLMISPPIWAQQWWKILSILYQLITNSTLMRHSESQFPFTLLPGTMPLLGSLLKGAPSLCPCWGLISVGWRGNFGGTQSLMS